MVTFDGLCFGRNLARLLLRAQPFEYDVSDLPDLIRVPSIPNPELYKAADAIVSAQELTLLSVFVDEAVMDITVRHRNPILRRSANRAAHYMLMQTDVQLQNR